MKSKITLAVVAAMMVLVSFIDPENYQLPPAANGYSVGASVTDFRLKNIDGKMVSMADFKEAKGFIVIFTDIDCKYTAQYEDRIMALDSKYRRKGFPVIAINPPDQKIETGPGDGYENMQMHAKRMDYTFPCLFDESRETAKAFGAEKTPSVYLIEKEADKYVVKYMGAIDDYADDAQSINYAYVQDAVNELLKGKPVTKNLTAVDGCDMRYK